MAEEVLRMRYEGGYSDVKEFLEYIDKHHDNKIKQKDPDEILFE